jgi:hypothetical protein
LSATTSRGTSLCWGERREFSSSCSHWIPYSPAFCVFGARVTSPVSDSQSHRTSHRADWQAVVSVWMRNQPREGTLSAVWGLLVARLRTGGTVTGHFLILSETPPSPFRPLKHRAERCGKAPSPASLLAQRHRDRGVSGQTAEASSVHRSSSSSVPACQRAECRHPSPLNTRFAAPLPLTTVRHEAVT